MTRRSTRAHYERLLSPIYPWMVGPDAMERSRGRLAALGVRPLVADSRALDLGAGHGLQSVPLADLGFSVTAIDSSLSLLSRLAEARPAVETIVADLLDLAAITEPRAYDLVVCMGDTLTHLPDVDAVDRLLETAVERLRPGGTLCLTFRDHATELAEAAPRCVLVRADDARILTCHLVYLGAHVVVTDLLLERSGDTWVARASTYEKLRLSPRHVVRRLQELGLALFVDELDERGEVTLVGRKGHVGRADPPGVGRAS